MQSQIVEQHQSSTPDVSKNINVPTSLQDKHADPGPKFNPDPDQFMDNAYNLAKWSINNNDDFCWVADYLDQQGHMDDDLPECLSAVITYFRHHAHAKVSAEVLRHFYNSLLAVDQAFFAVLKLMNQDNNKYSPNVALNSGAFPLLPK